MGVAYRTIERAGKGKWEILRNPEISNCRKERGPPSQESGGGAAETGAGLFVRVSEAQPRYGLNNHAVCGLLRRDFLGMMVRVLRHSGHV